MSERAPDRHDRALAFLEALEAPEAKERLRVYRRFSSAETGLPFPLAHLLKGVSKHRKSAASYVDCLNWFFETAFRFLLATVLDPLLRHAPLDDADWPLLDALLPVEGASRDLSMGGWRDLYFQCIRRAIQAPQSRKELPGVLGRFFDRPAGLARLEGLFSAFVSFRNRLEHGRRDGNVVEFLAREQELYERGLIAFLRELESLCNYGLFLRSPSDGELVPIDGIGQEGVLIDDTCPDPIRHALAVPAGPELFLGEWAGGRERVRAAWSLHPFLRLERTEDGGSRASLFRRYLAHPPRPRVVYDRAEGTDMLAVEVEEPDLLTLLDRLVGILRKRRGHTRSPAGTNVGELADRLAKEEARVRAEEDDAHRAWLDSQLAEKNRRRHVHKNRIPYPRDPHFKGRTADMERVLSGLAQGRSLQIRSCIQGLGGVGKTAMAVELCYRVIDAGTFSDGVLWYRVQDEPLEEAVAEAGAAIELGPDVCALADPQARVEAFRRAIRNLDLLVVLDNADYGLDVMQPRFDLFAGLPLIVTSRRDLPLHGAIMVNLEGLEPDEAGALVRASLGTRNGDREDAWAAYGSDEDVAELCRTLEHHPLALKLAAFHVLQNRLTLRRYLDRWRERRLEVLEATLAGGEPQHQNVQACFDLSYQSVSGLARRTLALMSLWEGREFAFGHLVKVAGPAFTWADQAPSAGHDGDVTCWARSHDGHGVVTGGADGRVLWWDEAGDRPQALYQLCQIDGQVTGVAIDKGKRLTIQDQRGGCLIATLGPAGRLSRSRTFSGSGRPWLLGATVEPHWYVPVGDGVMQVDVLDGFVRDRPPQSAESPEWLGTVCPVHFPVPTVDDFRALSLQLGTTRRHLISRLEAAGLHEESAAVAETKGARAPQSEAVGFPGTETPLRDVVTGELLTTSLATERMTPEGLRLRLHALVSEFASGHVEEAARDDLASDQTSLYLGLLEDDPVAFSSEEPNILAAVERFTTTAARSTLAALSPFQGWLEQLWSRGRWGAVSEVVESAFLAAEDGSDERRLFRIADSAYLLERLGRWDEARARRRLLDAGVERSREEAVLGEGASVLFARGLTEMLRVGSDVLRETGRVANDRFAWLEERRYDAKGQAYRVAIWCGGSADLVRQCVGPWESSDDSHTLAMWVEDGSGLGRAERSSLLRRYLSVARREHDVGTTAHALAESIAMWLEARTNDDVDELLDAYALTAQLRGVSWAHMMLGVFRAVRMHAAGDRDRAAELIEEARAHDTRPPGYAALGGWAPVAAIIAHDAGLVDRAHQCLTEERARWTALPADSRCYWHFAAAVLAMEQGLPARAQRALATHLAYARLESEPTAVCDVSERATALADEWGVADEHVDVEAQRIWGPRKQPRVELIKPRFMKKATAAGFSQDFLVAPSHLRWDPVRVGELRAWATAEGGTLPWYYRHHRPDAGDDEVARFVDYATARRVVAWLGELLPRSYGWPGLSSEVPWAITPPLSAPTKLDDGLRAVRSAAGLDDDAWAAVQPVLLGPLSATDQYRVVSAVAAHGPAGAPSWLARALSDRGAPSSGGTLRRDLRSVLFLLSDNAESVPDGTWLVPTEPVEPAARWDAHTLGAVGALARDPESTNVLAAAGAAWADVVVWPGTIGNLSPLDEEVPPWPSAP